MVSKVSTEINSFTLEHFFKTLSAHENVTCFVTFDINQGPDLQNIIRQSYDKVMTMTEVMTNHTTDAIYKKSYDKVMTNL